GRQDPRPGRRHPALRERRALRLLLWGGADRGLQRRRGPASPLPGRRPPTQLRAARHGHLPGPPALPRPGLLPAQAGRGALRQGGAALPQAAPRGRRLPPAHPRCPGSPRTRGLTQRGVLFGTGEETATRTACRARWMRARVATLAAPTI